MSDLLSIGASGIRAYSRALATVSDNIANAQTPGFARRSLRLEEATAGGDVVFYRNTIRPGGVLVAGIDRAVNQMLIDDARVAGSDSGRTSARLNWVQATERALDDGVGGVGASLTAIFNKADQLGADPANQALRSGFLASVDEATSAFRRTATSLQSSATGVASDAQGSVNQLNTNLIALERINDGLRRAREGSSNQAGLLDERDRVIDEISGTLAVNSSFNARGEASLRVAGPGGELLVDNGAVASVSLSIAAGGQLSYGLTPSATGTLTPISGRLAGLSEAATQIAGQRIGLDTLANQFSAQFNAANQAGRDALGNPGAALLDPGAGAGSIAAIALMPNDVAAADASSSNGNILSLANLRGPGGTEAGWANMVALQSQATAASRAQDAASSTRRDGAFDARDNVSAVDLDREAGDLLRYQQAYEGAARTIQVARETLQTILNIF